MAGVGLVGAGGRSARADLIEYVKKPEPKFSWKLVHNNTTPLGTIYEIEVVSQEWHGITWKHQLLICRAPGVNPMDSMLLWNSGGAPSLAGSAFGMSLSARIKAPVALLYGIPNQPLLDGKREDALIAETFVRFLETRDASWPLLFPMVKSLVKAMDVLQAFSKEKWQQELKTFVVAGASKRGWTSWLTGVADPRVKAIVPVVIDTLNMGAQLEHQKRSFGAYSEMIRDYTARGLVPLPKGEDARRLWSMVDPYFYRDRLKMPKLLIMGNNDPYWTVDALNLYWDGLLGDKWVSYIPNAGHDLRQAGVPKDEERLRSHNALSAFTRHQLTGKPLPKLHWKHDDSNGKARVVVTADPPPKAARLWLASAPTRDFRKAKWTEQKAVIDKDQVTGLVDRPTEGFRVFYAELEYEIDGIPYTLSSQVRVLERKVGCPRGSMLVPWVRVGPVGALRDPRLG